MKRNFLILFTAISLIFSSCKKDETTPIDNSIKEEPETPYEVQADDNIWYINGVQYSAQEKSATFGTVTVGLTNSTNDPSSTVLVLMQSRPDKSGSYNIVGYSKYGKLDSNEVIVMGQLARVQYFSINTTTQVDVEVRKDGKLSISIPKINLISPQGGSANISGKIVEY